MMESWVIFISFIVIVYDFFAVNTYYFCIMKQKKMVLRKIEVMLKAMRSLYVYLSWK